MTGFSPLLQLRLVDDILSYPPAKPWIRRVDGEGERVARFALPLDLCPSVNRALEWEGWRLGRCKTALRTLMWQQFLLQRQGIAQSLPLAGRPQVRAIRFSSRPVDRQQAWTKFPVDRLMAQHGGLGLIRDDAEEVLDLVDWWEPAPQGRGCVLLEVWTGSSDE